MSAIGVLKEDIVEIKTTNKETESKIKCLEKELEEDLEDAAENDADLFGPIIRRSFNYGIRLGQNITLMLPLKVICRKNQNIT